MIKVYTTIFWRWRYRNYWGIHAYSIGRGFMIDLPGLRIQIGHHCPACRECGSREKIITWFDENPGAAICPDCCEHPDYQRDDGQYWCVECGVEAPYDYGFYGD